MKLIQYEKKNNRTLSVKNYYLKILICFNLFFLFFKEKLTVFSFKVFSKQNYLID